MIDEDKTDEREERQEKRPATTTTVTTMKTDEDEDIRRRRTADIAICNKGRNATPTIGKRNSNKSAGTASTYIHRNAVRILCYYLGADGSIFAVH